MKILNYIAILAGFLCVLILTLTFPNYSGNDNYIANKGRSYEESTPGIQAIRTSDPGNYAITADTTTLQAFNDPYYSRQWALQKLLTLPLQYTESNTLIAILDTGIDAYHEDLKGKVVSSVNFSGSSSSEDINGHGTHVAGIIAATVNNKKGISSISPSHSLLNVKVAEDNGIVWPSSIAKGIVWAVDHGAKVINICLCVPAELPAMQKAVDYAWDKGAIVVASAGNQASSTASFPASYTNVISVGALDQAGKLWEKSNYGNWVNLYSFGVEIYSTFPENKYGYMSGTSMATAYVSAVSSNLFGQVTDNNGNGKLNDEVSAALQNIFPSHDLQ